LQPRALAPRQSPSASISGVFAISFNPGGTPLCYLFQIPGDTSSLFCTTGLSNALPVSYTPGSGLVGFSAGNGDYVTLHNALGTTYGDGSSQYDDFDNISFGYLTLQGYDPDDNSGDEGELAGVTIFIVEGDNSITTQWLNPNGETVDLSYVLSGAGTIYGFYLTGDPVAFGIAFNVTSQPLYPSFIPT